MKRRERTAIIVRAMAASARGAYVEAAQLFASVGISYVHPSTFKPRKECN